MNQDKFFNYKPITLLRINSIPIENWEIYLNELTFRYMNKNDIVYRIKNKEKVRNKNSSEEHFWLCIFRNIFTCIGKEWDCFGEMNDIYELLNNVEKVNFKIIHQKQVDDNFKAFNEILPTIIEAKRNQYALMKDCKIVEYFSTSFDAEKAGLLLYPDHMFSVQKVTDKSLLQGGL